MPKSSQVLLSLSESKTVAISDKVRQMKLEGISVISLSNGEPDFDTEPAVCEAGIEAIRAGETHYGDSRGLPVMRKAVADKFRRENAIEYDPDREVIVTASGKLALYISLLSILDPGDEVLILEPAWVSYNALVTLVGGVPVPVALDPADDFTLTREALEGAATPKTKAVIFNSPNNPSGRVCDEQEIAALCDFARERDLWVISDEIYEHLIYDGKKNISPASRPGMRERCITVNGMSKAYAMTGWRLGFIGSPMPHAAQVLKAQQHVITCAPGFCQVAGAAALNGSKEYLAAMVAEYDKRRKAAAAALNAMPGVRCPMPGGAFYLMPEINFRGYDSWQLTEYLLEKARVAVTPGQAFASRAVRNVRMAYATSMEEILLAMERIGEALAKG